MRKDGLKNNTRVVGFDADDTLWVNEDYFRAAEKEYTMLLSDFGTQEEIMKELFQTEMKNLKLLGYGVKPFVISMIENAIRISDGKVSTALISKFIEIGRDMLEKPLQILPGVREVLEDLHGRYKLIVATKGDLLDQERKLNRSGLAMYFHHIEIMSEKSPDAYKKLLSHLEVEAENFVMIGNSLKSDILAPYEIGCSAIHVPYALTWQHEMDVEDMPESERLISIDSLIEVIKIL